MEAITTTVHVPTFGSLLTAEEAAELLRVSPATIYRLMRSRELEVVRIGRCVRTSPQALQDYCARVQSQGK